MNFIYEHREPVDQSITHVRFGEEERRKKDQLIERLPESDLNYYHTPLPGHIVINGIIKRKDIFRLLRGEDPIQPNGQTAQPLPVRIESIEPGEVLS